MQIDQKEPNATQIVEQMRADPLLAFIVLDKFRNQRVYYEWDIADDEYATRACWTGRIMRVERDDDTYVVRVDNGIAPIRYDTMQEAMDEADRMLLAWGCMLCPQNS